MGLFLVIWITTFLALQAQVAWAGGSSDDDSSKGTSSHKGQSTSNSTTSSTSHPSSTSNTALSSSSSSTPNTTRPPSTTASNTSNSSTASVNGTSHLLPGSASPASTSASGTSSPSAALDNTTSSPSAPSVSTSTVNEHSGTNSAIIAAASLGAILLAVLGLIIIFLFLRRRRRKSLTVNLGDPYTFAVSSPPSPTHSRSWLFRKLGDNTEEDSSTRSSTRRGPKVDPSWAETINFYHTPRTPPKAFVKNSAAGGESTVVSGTDISLSSIRFSPKTERQMEIEERIKELEGKLTLLQRSIRAPEGRPDSRALTNLTHNMRIGRWRNQIETLQDSMSSDWALGRTDIIPKGLYVAKSID